MKLQQGSLRNPIGMSSNKPLAHLIPTVSQKTWTGMLENMNNLPELMPWVEFEICIFHSKDQTQVLSDTPHYNFVLCVLSHFSHVRLFATLWTVALQVSLSVGFSRQEYWRGLPCPPPGDLPDPGIKPKSLKSPALAGRFFSTSST